MQWNHEIHETHERKPDQTPLAGNPSPRPSPIGWERVVARARPGGGLVEFRITQLARPHTAFGTVFRVFRCISWFSPRLSPASLPRRWPGPRAGGSSDSRRRNGRGRAGDTPRAPCHTLSSSRSPARSSARGPEERMVRGLYVEQVVGLVANLEFLHATRDRWAGSAVCTLNFTSCGRSNGLFSTPFTTCFSR